MLASTSSLSMAPSPHTAPRALLSWLRPAHMCDGLNSEVAFGCVIIMRKEHHFHLNFLIEEPGDCVLMGN